MIFHNGGLFMPGRHVTDQQMRLFMTLKQTHTVPLSAAKAGISQATGYRFQADPTLPSHKKTPRGRRRPDPLADIFDAEVVPMLQSSLGIRPVAIYEEVLRRHPELASGIRRTLERRIRAWNAEHGPEQEVMFRSVPVPPEFLDTLTAAHEIREAQKSRRKSAAPIWGLSRVRIWQIVKRVMIEAHIPDAPHRSPKGFRHGFGINATVNGVPLHMVQKWMGHAQLSTTAIYADAVGKEDASDNALCRDQDG